MLSFILCLYIISFPFAGYASYANFWSPHCFSSLRVNTLDTVPSCDLHGLSPPPMQGVYFEECVIQEGKRSLAKRDKEGRTRISKTKTKEIKIRRNKNSFQSFVNINFHFISLPIYIWSTLLHVDIWIPAYTCSLLLEEKNKSSGSGISSLEVGCIWISLESNFSDVGVGAVFALFRDCGAEASSETLRFCPL